jgi:hypothetical protein
LIAWTIIDSETGIEVEPGVFKNSSGVVTLNGTDAVTTASIEIVTLADEDPEYMHKYRVTLEALPSAHTVRLLTGRGHAAVHVEPSDGANGGVAFVDTDAIAAVEPAVGNSNLYELTVEAFEDAANEAVITVTWSIEAADGVSPVDAADFGGKSTGTVRVKPGKQSKFNITVSGDATSEPLESYKVVLTGAVRASNDTKVPTTVPVVRGDSSFVELTIKQDDDYYGLLPTGPRCAMSVKGDKRTLRITYERSNKSPAGAAVKIDVAYEGQSIVEDLEWASADAREFTGTFQPGKSTVTMFYVIPSNVALKQGSEFSVKIGENFFTDEGSKLPLVATGQNNTNADFVECLAVGVTAANGVIVVTQPLFVTEPNRAGKTDKIEVSRENGTFGIEELIWNWKDSGNDQFDRPLSGSVRFAQGEQYPSRNNLIIKVKPDSLSELDETVTMELSTSNPLTVIDVVAADPLNQVEPRAGSAVMDIVIAANDDPFGVFMLGDDAAFISNGEHRGINVSVVRMGGTNGDVIIPFSVTPNLKSKIQSGITAFEATTGNVEVPEGSSSGNVMLELNAAFKELPRGTVFTITLGDPALSDSSASDYASKNVHAASPPAIYAKCPTGNCGEKSVTVESDRNTFGVLTCGAKADCSVSVTEGSGVDAECPAEFPQGTVCKMHTIALVREPELKEKVVFQYKVYPSSEEKGAAESNSDFVQQEWSDVFIDKYTSNAELTYYVIDDSESEHEEQFVITVKTGDGLEIAPEVQTIAVTILKNDQPGGLFQFESAEDIEKREPDFGATREEETVIVPVTRTQGTLGTITLLWTATGATKSFTPTYGQQVFNEDGSMIGELVFEAGKTTPENLLSFQVTHDQKPELAETLEITLCVRAEGDAAVCADDAATTDASIGELATASVVIPANDNPIGTFSATPSPYVMIGDTYRSLMIDVEREGGNLVAVAVLVKVLGSLEKVDVDTNLQDCAVGETDNGGLAVIISSEQWDGGCQAAVLFAVGESSKRVEVSVTDTVELVAGEMIDVTIAPVPAAAGSLVAWKKEGRHAVWDLTNDDAVDRDSKKNTASVWIPESAADGQLEFAEESRVLTVSEPNAGEPVSTVTLAVNRVGGTYVPAGSGSLLVECIVVRSGAAAVYGLQPAIQYLSFESGQKTATVTLQLQADNIAEIEVKAMVQISSPPSYCEKGDEKCFDAPVSVPKDTSAAGVTVPASDDPYGVIEFADVSVAQLITGPGKVTLYVKRSSGEQGPFEAVVVPYRVLGGAGLETVGEITFGNPADPDVELREDGLQLLTLDIDIDGEETEYTVELKLDGGQYSLGANALASISLPTVAASGVDQSGCTNDYSVAEACFGITAEKVERGLVVSASRIAGCVEPLATSEVDLSLTLCATTVAAVEGALGGVIAWASRNGGYARIGGVDAVMSVLDQLRDQPNGNGQAQSEQLTKFALSLLAGNCVPDTENDCECCCTASEESADGMVVVAKRVLAAQLDTPITPELVYYPEVRLPANTQYLAGFDRFSKSVCEEVYLVKQAETEFGILKAPEGQTLFSGVLNGGIAKDGFAATLAAAKKRVAQSANPAGSLQFDIDVGGENNNRECVSWSADTSEWSTDGCSELQQVESIVTCECEQLAESYGLLIAEQASFPTFIVAGAAIVVVAAAILFFCCFVIAALSGSVVGTVMMHVSVATMLLHLMFIINIMLTKTVDATGQFVLGLLLHYFILAYGCAITAALYFLYGRFNAPITETTKSGMSKFVLRAVWIVPVAVVLCSILFGLEAYDKTTEDVYGDVSGNDKLSLIPSSGLFYAGFLAEFVLLGILSLVLAGATFVGEQKTDVYDVEAQKKGEGKDAAGLSVSEIRTTSGLLLWCWVAPVLLLVALSTGVTDLEYVVAIASVVQGIALLVYCFAMADPGDEPEPAEEISLDAPNGGAAAAGPDASQPMVVNSTTSFQSMHGPTRSAAWTAFDGGVDSPYGGEAPPTQDAGFSPALVDTAEFDDLIFSLKANPVANYDALGASSSLPGVVGLDLGPVASSSMSEGSSVMNNRLSIADTHL